MDTQIELLIIKILILARDDAWFWYYFTSVFFLQVFLRSADLSAFVFPQMFVANTWLGSIVFTLSLEQQAKRISLPPCVP